MKKIQWAGGFLAILASLLFACNESEFEPVDFGYEYYPIKTGSWIEYQVDSIVHNGTDTPNDTFSFRVREVIGEPFGDLARRASYVIERHKIDSNGNWFIQRVDAVNKLTTRVERLEDNQRFVKLVFPAEQDKEWNGNSVNSLSREDYFYEYVGESDRLNNRSFRETAKIIQFDQSDPIVRTYYGEERYAKNVGLIYKRFIHIELQPDSGLDLTMQVLDYGDQ